MPTWKLRGSQLAHAAALGLLDRRGHRPGRPGSLAGRTAHGDLVAKPAPADVQVDPGNTEIERGTSLLVVARFKGGVPAEASLVVDDQARTATRRGMTRSLEDPTFAGRVESVDADLAYRVEFEGKSTETFHVRVFEYPELERTDAKLVFPAVHVARAEDRRGHPPRHGRRGDRADLALPAQQRRRHGPAGRRGGPGDRAQRRTKTASMSTARPSRSPTRGGSRSSWSTAKGGPTSWRPRSWRT